MPVKYVTEHEHGVHCPNCQAGYVKITEANKAKDLIGEPCGECPGSVYVEYDADFDVKVYVCRCGSEEVEERYSLGITAGYWCKPCWAKSGYRKEGREGFDPDYTGETYEEED